MPVCVHGVFRGSILAHLQGWLERRSAEKRQGPERCSPRTSIQPTSCLAGPSAQLSYLPTSCGHLVADQLPNTWLPSAELARLALTQPGCQRVFLALLAAAYCGSLWMAYWREVGWKSACSDACMEALSLHACVFQAALEGEVVAAIRSWHVALRRRGNRLARVRLCLASVLLCCNQCFLGLQVKKRKAFAQAQGFLLSTTWLDALSPLFFALPALLQARAACRLHLACYRAFAAGGQPLVAAAGVVHGAVAGWPCACADTFFVELVLTPCLRLIRLKPTVPLRLPMRMCMHRASPACLPVPTLRTTCSYPPCLNNCVHVFLIELIAMPVVPPCQSGYHCIAL